MQPESVCPTPFQRKWPPIAAALSNRIQPEAAGVVQKFPNWLHRFHANGLFASSDGTRYCQYGALVPSSEACDRIAERYEKFAAEQSPSVYEKLASTPLRQRGDGGYAMIGNDYFPLVRFLANPEKVTNQKAVQNYLEETVLQSPMDFFNRSYEEILNCFHKMHVLFWNKVQHNLPVESYPGQYRDELSLVTEEKGDLGMFEAFKRILLKKGGSDRDVWRLKKIVNKLRIYHLREALAQFTKAEMRVFRKIAFIPTLPELIPEKMRNLALRLKEIGPQVIRGELDGLAAASWFHQAFGNIHPYDDNNGHIARSFGNTLMQLGGYHAAVFPNDDIYSAAVEEDQSYPGQFARYLSDVQLWNRDRRALKG